MTIEEKITRYRGIPRLIEDLQIDKEICTSVKSVQFDGIGGVRGTHGNSTEKKLLDAAEISEKIAALQQERDRLELSIMQHINTTLCGSVRNRIKRFCPLPFTAVCLPRFTS